ncbi:MAG: efflux transporter outer membrane subunit [Rickettsiella sp.]|nr:efflux transporter outer membrane subunit [Rickettsiella sp.]
MILANLSACLVGPDFKSPMPPKIRHYTERPWTYKTASVSGKAGVSQRFIKAENISPQWWRSFHSRKLNKLVCRGLVNSPNLSAAKAVLREAQENLNASVGNLFPAFTAQLSAQRGSGAGFFNSNASNSTVTGSNVPTGSVFTLLNAAVNVAYALDLFGGVRRGIEALQSQVDYQYFEWRAAYLSLTGNIVTTSIAMASLQTQIRVTKQLICEQEDQLRIIKQQFKLGGASGADVLAQETQVAQTKATLPPLEKSRDQTRHALAILVGSFPSASCLPTLYLSELTLPTRLPLCIPSSLVRHRPDVRAAEALWKAANAQVGVATANLYPQFTITGTYGKSDSIGNKLIGSQQSNLWSIGGTLLQPLFKGGMLIAQRRAAIAAYDQAAAQYQQVVLQAFQNVADTLRALEADARELRAQKKAELAAHAALKLTRQQFYLGGVSYLTLLDAQRQYQQTRISLIRAQASRYTDTAALYQALGGGWWNC